MAVVLALSTWTFANVELTPAILPLPLPQATSESIRDKPVIFLIVTIDDDADKRVTAEAANQRCLRVRDLRLVFFALDFFVVFADFAAAAGFALVLSALTESPGSGTTEVNGMETSPPASPACIPYLLG